MIFKHNKRNWKYRTLAMLSGYQFRVPAFTVPAPLCNPTDTPTNRPDDPLIGAIAADTFLCPSCQCNAPTWSLCMFCTRGRCILCCTCGKGFESLPTDLDPQPMGLIAEAAR